MALDKIVIYSSQEDAVILARSDLRSTCREFALSRNIARLRHAALYGNAAVTTAYNKKTRKPSFQVAPTTLAQGTRQRKICHLVTCVHAQNGPFSSCDREL